MSVIINGGGGAAGRTILTADTTYYVATTGNDSNDGSSGSPWLTLQHAYDFICALLDLGGFAVTIQVEDGTYSAGVSLNQPWTGGGTVTFTGNTGTPANVHINGDPFFTNFVTLPGIFSVQGFKTSNATWGVYNDGVGFIYAGNIEFGGGGNANITADTDGANIFWVLGDATISGSSINHFLAQSGSNIITGGTTTITGTPSFTVFAEVETGASLSAFETYVGTATGKRFNVITNGIIWAGAPISLTYYPGDVAGTINTGGIYEPLTGENSIVYEGVTITNLPSGPVAGQTAYIIDGDGALAWGATAVNSGAGATKYLVWYNGTNWTIAGK